MYRLWITQYCTQNFLTQTDFTNWMSDFVYFNNIQVAIYSCKSLIFKKTLTSFHITHYNKIIKYIKRSEMHTGSGVATSFVGFAAFFCRMPGRNGQRQFLYPRRFQRNLQVEKGENVCQEIREKV